MATCKCGNTYDDMGFKTQCTDCFKKEKRLEDNPQFLGMVLNQAINLLASGIKLDEEEYKKRVRTLFKLNKELKEELLK